MVNYNPETVSTDYDVSDKLYFEELTIERILDIYEKENPLGIITSVGGQIPNNLSMTLSEAGVKILGTSAQDVDLAEDRSKFSALLDQLGIRQPSWSKLQSIEDAKRFAKKSVTQLSCAQAMCSRAQPCVLPTTKSSLENFLNLAAKVCTRPPSSHQQIHQPAPKKSKSTASPTEKTSSSAQSWNTLKTQASTAATQP